MRSAAAFKMSNALLRVRRKFIRISVRRGSTEAEVHKFSQMGADWWNPTKNPLLAMNPVRMQFISECLGLFEKQSLHDEEKHNSTSNDSKETTTSRRILDVGCGGGLLAESWVRSGMNHSVIGVDPSAALLAVAQQHAAATLPMQLQSRLQYICGTVEEAFPAESEQPFDIISCCDVIEHVPDPAALIHAMSERLRPGGLMFVSTIDRTFLSYLVTIVGAEYLTGLLPIGTHDYNKYLSPSEVALLTTRAGLVPRRIAGMVVPAPALPAAMFLRQWSWQLDPKDTRVNWIGCYQKEK
jgi:2-polyprenyl-6-hydroxyphenyl methylase / 3-demethylubiquinone-9 3-methyltransferase